MPGARRNRHEIANARKGVRSFGQDSRTCPPNLKTASRRSRISRIVCAPRILGSETEVLRLREQANHFKRELGGFVLGQAPRTMTGTIERLYAEYRQNRRRSEELIADIGETLTRALDEINPSSPQDIALSELNANVTFIQRRLRKWNGEAAALLESERHRLASLFRNRSGAYRTLMLPLIDDVAHERLSLNDALLELERERAKQDFDNSELFEPYLSALQSLAESIDLVSLAGFGMDQADELRSEIDRLHGLAQLGITFEIIGHEIEGLEHAITAALRRFPEPVRSTDAYRIVTENHEALIDRLRFLSPLKLSGEKMKRDLSGQDILDYVRRFFGDSLSRNDIKLKATPAFLSFSVYELPSRICPVFINLVNNAAYWVRQVGDGDKKILLDTVDSKVVVADDGPGVEDGDLKQLFTLFFTRKVRGGRGVGLYLCRANLAAGGHGIAYATDEHLKRLSGANFVIDFKGAKNG